MIFSERIELLGSRQSKLLCPFFAKSSKDFQLSGIQLVLSGLFETKAEDFPWDLENLEVPSQVLVIEVVVVVSRINFCPRGPVV